MMIKSSPAAPVWLPEQERSRFPYDLLLFVFLFASLVISLYFKDNRLWMDEVYTILQLRDPSLTHMNAAIGAGVETNPPLFFSLYWLIGHAVSLDPFFLKAVSVLLFAGTVALFFRYSTRLIGHPGRNLLIFITAIAFTHLNYAQSSQLRSYSVYLLLSFGHVLFVHKLFSRPGSARLLAGQFLTGLALMLTHNYGMFFVAVCVGIFGPLFLWSRQKQYLIPLISGAAIFGSWMVLWYADFQTQALHSQHGFWIQKPTFLSFFHTIGDLVPTIQKLDGLSPLVSVGRVLLVTGAFATVALRQFKPSFTRLMEDRAYSFFLLCGYVFIGTSVTALLVSLFYVPILVSRYLWPNHLFLLYILAYLFYKPGAAKAFSFSGKVNWLVVGYACLLSVFMFSKGKSYSVFPGKVEKHVDALDKRYPVFYETSFYFLPMNYYGIGNAHFWLDWPTSLRTGTTSEFRGITLLNTYYPLKGIVPTAGFTAKAFPHFYIFDEAKSDKFETLIETGKIRIIQEIPVAIPGCRLLECVRP